MQLARSVFTISTLNSLCDHGISFFSNKVLKSGFIIKFSNVLQAFLSYDAPRLENIPIEEWKNEHISQALKSLEKMFFKLSLRRNYYISTHFCRMCQLGDMVVRLHHVKALSSCFLMFFIFTGDFMIRTKVWIRILNQK